MVIGHRVRESRERGHLGIGRKGGRVEAKVSNRIYLEDRIAGDIPGNRGFRCGVVGRCSRISAKNFAGVLSGLTQQILPYQELGKEAVGLRRSGRCLTGCREWLLRRGGGRRFGGGQSASRYFGRILLGCPVVQCFRNEIAIARGQSDARDGRGVFALGGRWKQGWLRAPYHIRIGVLSRPS